MSPRWTAATALLAWTMLILMPGTVVAERAASNAVKCFESWTEAAPVVASEQLVSVSDLSRMTRQRLSEDLIKTTLCREGGRFVYVLVVRSPSGTLRNLTLDARAPF